MRQLTKAEQCRNLMYRKTMLSKLNYWEISTQLNDMIEMCGNIKYLEQDDPEIINAFDGNEDDAHEFIMAFSDLVYDLEELSEQLTDIFGYGNEENFNETAVGLVGKYYETLGFDSLRDDYYLFDSGYSEEIGVQQTRERVMRKTKKQMLDDIGFTMALILQFTDLEYRYNSLEATVGIFKDENIKMLKLVKNIDDKYNEMFDKKGKLDKYSKAKEIREFDKMVKDLPDKYWVE